MDEAGERSPAGRTRNSEITTRRLLAKRNVEVRVYLKANFLCKVNSRKWRDMEIKFNISRLIPNWQLSSQDLSALRMLGNQTKIVAHDYVFKRLVKTESIQEIFDELWKLDAERNWIRSSVYRKLTYRSKSFPIEVAFLGNHIRKIKFSAQDWFQY